MNDQFWLPTQAAGLPQADTINGDGAFPIGTEGKSP